MAKQQDNPQSNPQSNPLPDNSPSGSLEPLIQQALRAYDDLGEVTALHRWTYDALHAQLISDIGFNANYHDFGLSLLFDWLKLRDQTARDNIEQVLKRMRALSSSHSVEEPRVLYGIAAG